MCNDPDAPVGNWIHWLVHDIPPNVSAIPSGGPVPGVQLKNDFGDASWGGPAPPSGTHRYVFTLYALSVEHLTSANKRNLKDLCESKKIASAQLIGTYTRK
jgi:Raf kinase inhibitor-like YbhB/YbcL family protein